jgi:hypothetical protein
VLKETLAILVVLEPKETQVTLAHKALRETQVTLAHKALREIRVIQEPRGTLATKGIRVVQIQT